MRAKDYRLDVASGGGKMMWIVVLGVIGSIVSLPPLLAGAIGLFVLVILLGLYKMKRGWRGGGTPGP